MDINTLYIATYWALIATPVIILGGFIFAWWQLKSMRNARVAELMVALGNMWDSDGMAESRRKITESGKNIQRDYEAADKANQIEVFTSYTRVANFFDELGALVAEGLLDVRIAYDVWGKAEKTYYAIYEPMITTPKYEEYVQYFAQLHDLFTIEKARRSNKVAKKRRASRSTN